MTILEGQNITIRLPRLNWQMAVILFFILTLSSGVWYWFYFIRPFLCLDDARVEANITMISSDVSGHIIEMGPQEGDFVKKGQTLFTFDSELVKAKRQVDLLEKDIEMEKRRAEKAVQDYITATNELELGIGSIEKVTKQLELMEETQHKSERASTQLMAARSALFDLEQQIKKMTAPFDGIILKKIKNVGSVVPFGEPIYVLCDADHVWIETEIPEDQLSLVRVGTHARVQLPAYPKKEFAGKVAYIGPATVSKSSGQLPSSKKETLPLKIAIENPNNYLKPGLSARVCLKVH